MTIKKQTKKLQLIKLSASSVKTYEQCPKKYFFNYIERVPRKEWDHLGLGHLCHKTLEFFHEYCMKKYVNKNDYAEIMSKSFIKARKAFPKLSGNIVQKAKDLLSVQYLDENGELKLGYLGMLKKEGIPNVQGIETSFSFYLNDKILVRGLLDRFDLMRDGRFHIIDYKTTKNTQYIDDFQLLVYGLWLKKKYPEMQSFRGSYILLRHNSNSKSYDFTIEDINKIEKTLIEYGNKIMVENVWTPIPTRLCDWCDFKNICPAQQTW
jgi:putative RecB family exonuclease